jgi:tetratricopeptide (TPR) repeat protein
MNCEPGDDVCYGSEYYGDHEWGGSLNEFRFLHTPEAIYHHYRGLYLSIYPDNLVIEYFGNKADATDYQKQAVAEARVLRAYNYFLLAFYWGTPPFVDHLLDASVIPVKSDDENSPEGSPKSQQEYFRWVGDQCMLAADNLPERQSTGDKEGAYRVTKGFAWAMAGKAYMFAGDYAKAKDCLKKVIDSGKYRLLDKFIDNFNENGIKQLHSGNLYARSIKKFSSVMEDRDKYYLNAMHMRYVLAAFFMISLCLGVIGTFWLQTKVRKEDVGVMLSFGGTPKTIMGMLMGEGAMLCTIAVVVGCLIYMQYGISEGLVNDYMWGGAREDSPMVADSWIDSFPQHFLIVSGIIWLIMTIVVLIGIFIPAHKISHVQPTEALRDE